MGTNLPTSAGITSIWLLATTVAMDFAGSMISFSWQGLYSKLLLAGVSVIMRKCTEISCQVN